MSNNYRLILTPEAQSDIHDIVMYIAQELKAPQAALALQESFAKCIYSLAYMPKRVRTVDAARWKKAGLRRIRVKDYYIYFIVSDDELTITVLAVIYFRRNQAKQMREMLSDRT